MFIINKKCMYDMSPYARFWSSKLSSRPWLLNPVKCPECGKALRQGCFDYDKHVISEGLLPDMLYGGDLIVSERFRTAWLASGLKGIDDFLPIPVYQRKNKRYVSVKQLYYSVVVNVPHFDITHALILSDQLLYRLLAMMDDLA